MRSRVDANARSDHATLLVAGVVFCGFFAVYYGTRQHNLSTYHDAAAHLWAVLGDAGPHPHHVLFRWMERGWLWSTGTLAASPYVAAANVATLSALWAAGVVTLVFLILRWRFALSRTCAAIGAALVGFSYGLWLHATVINVYVGPLALLLGCLLLLTGPSNRVGTYAAVGALHALAVLIHQACVLFAAVVVLAVWMERRDSAFRVRCLLTYGTIFGVLVAGTYVLVGALVYRARSVGDFAYWITTYAHEGYWKVPGIIGVVKAVMGFTRAGFGLLFVFKLPGVHELAARIFLHGLQDEDFLVREVPVEHAVVFFGATCLGVALIIALLIASRRSAKEVWSLHPRASALVAATLAVFGAFFVFWKPELLEFWIPQLTMFWLLWAALVLRPDVHVAVRAWAAVLIGVTLVVSNYVGGIRHLARPQNDFYYACVAAAGEHVTRDARILVPSEHLSDYMKMFLGIVPQRIMLPDVDDPGAIDPLRLADQLSAAGAGRDAPVAAYVVGARVPAPLLARAAGPPHTLVETPCLVTRLDFAPTPEAGP